MITPAANTTNFYSAFSVGILVTNTSSGTTIVSAPVVSASFVDPGIVITSDISGLVTISGMYKTIIPIGYTWRDNSFNLKTGTTAPNAGEYQKFIKIDSPASTSADCTYTITTAYDSGTITDTYVDHVIVDSFTKVADILTGLLAGVKP
jgi:hypothetical protein